MTSNLKLATEIELLQLSNLDQYIKDLSQFLKEYSWLFNIHVIDFFTDNSWNKIPEGWREIENVIDLMGLIEMASSNEINENYPPELKTFLKRAKSLCVQNIYFEETCLDKINERAGTMTHRLTARMRPKKVHEVAIMSQYLSEFCKENEINTVVDLGSGQGYLSRITSLEHGLNVLAVDSNAHNTKVSQDIEARAYRSIRKLGNAGKILHTTLNIQQDNLNELQDVIDNFQKDCEAETHDWLLCGLHTCGNLAVNTLKMFLNSQAKGCVSVGCCYNFLEPTPYGQDFPISKFVYDEMLELPKLAFRAACQTPFNWMADTELTSDFYRKHFYRALIHKVMMDKQFLKPEDPFPVMGRLLKPAFENFATYANTCLKQTKNPAVDSEELLQLEKDNAHGKFRIAFMWTLQGILAPVFESLILADRLKYLHESNVRATIVPLFDLAKSPRCFGIVGVKN